MDPSPTLQTLAVAAGWIGATGTVSAYFLLSADRIKATSTTFQTMNAIGAALLAASAASAASWPSAAVNLVWTAIGVHALTIGARARTATVPGVPPQPCEEPPELHQHSTATTSRTVAGDVVAAECHHA